MARRRAAESPLHALLQLAATQEGLFSAAQAKSAGVSQQLLAKYVASKRIERVQRALYRVKYFPPGQHEDLVAVWLWSRNEGVFSHETALYLFELSDALPGRAHITLPLAWQERAVRIPKPIAVHYDDLDERERSWVGAVPVTSVRRTLTDCLHAEVAPELVAQASEQAAQRGLISPSEVIAAGAISLWRARVHRSMT